MLTDIFIKLVIIHHSEHCSLCFMPRSNVSFWHGKYVWTLVSPLYSVNLKKRRNMTYYIFILLWRRNINIVKLIGGASLCSEGRKGNECFLRSTDRWENTKARCMKSAWSPSIHQSQFSSVSMVAGILSWLRQACTASRLLSASRTHHILPYF